MCRASSFRHGGFGLHLSPALSPWASHGGSVVGMGAGAGGSPPAKDGATTARQAAMATAIEPSVVAARFPVWGRVKRGAWFDGLPWRGVLHPVGGEVKVHGQPEQAFRVPRVPRGA